MSTAVETTLAPVADRLRAEIERLDQEILAAIRLRSTLSRKVGDLQLAGGSPRIQQRHEMAVLERFLDLGPEGRTIGMALLRLGRGRIRSVRPDSFTTRIG